MNVRLLTGLHTVSNSYVFRRSQVKVAKMPPISVELSVGPTVRLSICPHATAREDCVKFILGSVTKICQHILILSKIGHK